MAEDVHGSYRWAVDLRVRMGVRKLNGLGGSLCLDLLDESEIAELIHDAAEEKGV